jgi:hypothetical protein
MNHFTLQNKAALLHLNGCQPTFVKPSRAQFGQLDTVCNTIVEELEKRNFDIPNLSVEFCLNYQKGSITVCEVIGEDFKLFFAGNRIYTMNIPQKELSVFDDNSGPTLNVYVGNCWKRDKEEFMNGSKVNSKLDGEPKLYLRYNGAFGLPNSELSHCYPSSWKNHLRPYLIHNNDLGHDPDEGEATFYSTSAVFDEFSNWLEKNVLEYILSFPVQDKDLNLFKAV